MHGITEDQQDREQQAIHDGHLSHERCPLCVDEEDETLEVENRPMAEIVEGRLR